MYLIECLMTNSYIVRTVTRPHCTPIVHCAPDAALQPRLQPPAPAGQGCTAGLRLCTLSFANSTECNSRRSVSTHQEKALACCLGSARCIDPCKARRTCRALASRPRAAARSSRGAETGIGAPQALPRPERCAQLGSSAMFDTGQPGSKHHWCSLMTTALRACTRDPAVTPFKVVCSSSSSAPGLSVHRR